MIDHTDLDRVAAEGLVEADAAAVLNVAASMTGRYPNYGPLLVVASGIVLVDDLGPDLLESLHDGDVVTVVDNEVWRGEEQLASGVPPRCPRARGAHRGGPAHRSAPSSSGSPPTPSST